MSNALFEKGREGFLAGDIDWDAHTIKIMLADLNTADVGVKAITGATNAAPIVITSTGHGFATGDRVAIGAVGGNTAANGNHTITVIDVNTFSLDGSTGNGVYTSGGWVVNLTLADNLDDVDACRVGTDQTLGTKTVTNGVADAADPTWTAVSGATVEAAIIYRDTGVASTSRTIAFLDTITGFPFTPSGSDVTINFDNGVNKIFKL